MDFTIVWTEAAVDLEGAVRHVGETSTATAETLLGELLDSVDILARFPSIGPVYDRDRTGRSREISCKAYRIFYRVEERRGLVEILAVWHGSRREPARPW